MADRLGDAPIQKELRDLMNALASGLDDVLNGDVRPKRVGFVLMAFPFGDNFDGRCNYISNAERADIIVLLKEQLARFDGQAESKGGRD